MTGSSSKHKSYQISCWQEATDPAALPAGVSHEEAALQLTGTIPLPLLAFWRQVIHFSGLSTSAGEPCMALELNSANKIWILLFSLWSWEDISNTNIIITSASFMRFEGQHIFMILLSVSNPQTRVWWLDTSPWWHSQSGSPNLGAEIICDLQQSTLETSTSEQILYCY